MSPKHPKLPKPRGFAALDPEVRREIARKGGVAAHEKGTAHEFTSEEAQRAGQRGGTTLSQDRAHMAAIGQRGGWARRRDASSTMAGGETSAEPHPKTRPIGVTP